MEEVNVEVQETQNNPEVTTPKVDEVKLTVEELADLKHKAEVSSQNYERAKKAEARLKELEGNNVLLEVEGGDKDSVVLRKELSELKNWKEKSEVLEANPVLKGAWNDFEIFRDSEENRGMSIKTAAKAFMIEKGLLDPQRKGLERPTGGPKITQSPSMNADEITRLRTSDFRKYRDLIKKGQIKV